MSLANFTHKSKNNKHSIEILVMLRPAETKFDHVPALKLCPYSFNYILSKKTSPKK